MDLDYKELIASHVKQALNDSFGGAVGTMIFASASNSASVPIHDPSRDDYMRLVDAVCADQRVLDMWGEMGAADKRRQWRDLG